MNKKRNKPAISTPSPLPDAAVGINYSAQLAASGTAPIKWIVTGLPSWASSTVNGQIIGLPDNTGVFSLSITASNQMGKDGPRLFSLTVLPPPPPAPPPVP